MKFGPTKPNAVKPTASPVKGQGVTGGPRPGPVNPSTVRPAAPNQMQFMSDKLRGAPAPNQMQFMSDKLRGSPMTGPLGSMGTPPATPPAGLNLAGIRQAPAGLGDTFKGVARPPTSLANLGSALQQLGAGRAMKKGGAVKSSASKRGDGIAQRGKTKGRIV